MPTTLIEPAPEALPPLALSALTGPLAITVREYGERWIKTRDDIETVADEIGRLRNHIFPALGHLKMREVRPLPSRMSPRRRCSVSIELLPSWLAS